MKILSNDELVVARVAFLRDGGTAYYEAKRLYEKGDCGLHKFMAVCSYGQKDANESYTLFEKYPGRFFRLTTFEEVLTCVVDVLMWKYEREGRPFVYEVDGVQILQEIAPDVRVPIPSDDFEADVRTTFAALLDAVPTDAPVWTKFSVEELPNSYFVKDKFLCEN